jgi:hypothetical protein
MVSTLRIRLLDQDEKVNSSVYTISMRGLNLRPRNHLKFNEGSKLTTTHLSLRIS